MSRLHVRTICLLLVTVTAFAQSIVLLFPNASGQGGTVNVNGHLDLNNPFFQELGTNGRTCVTCHQPSEGWSITPQGASSRFFSSRGADALFRTNDGSNCEGVVPATFEEQRQAYSLLLNRGLIRVELAIPANAEFVIESVNDPFGCASKPGFISVYRRPLPSTNLRFHSEIMWDGRESFTSTPTPQSIFADLVRQANNATRGHAQAFADLTTEQREQIVNFEMGLFTAQTADNAAGSLTDAGATGGPEALVNQQYFTGINDPNTGTFDFNPFKLFNAWNSLPISQDPVVVARRGIANGQSLFNGFCGACHNTPNVGTRSVVQRFDHGLSVPTAVTFALPVYTIRVVSGAFAGTVVQTTDPGRAMITGRGRDLNRFKVPALRGLSARAPYFHNGAAATLEAVISRYRHPRIQNFRPTPQETANLAAFLKSL